MGFPCGSAGKESTCNEGHLGFIPGLRRSPGEGKGYPLQDSGLENSLDCIIHGVARSETWLSDFHFHYYHTHYYISDIIVVILQCICVIITPSYSVSLHSHRFCNWRVHCGWKTCRKKNSGRFQKTELQFSTHWQLFTYCLHWLRHCRWSRTDVICLRGCAWVMGNFM